MARPGLAGVVPALLRGAPGGARADRDAPRPTVRPSTLELAKKAQDPIAGLVSLPLQSNLNFGYGAKDAPQRSSKQYLLDIQPVIPITLGDTGVNLITRPILPVIRQPDLIDGGDSWGLGDLRAQVYHNLVKPDDDAAADGTVRLQVQLLFPK